MYTMTADDKPTRTYLTQADMDRIRREIVDARLYAMVGSSSIYVPKWKEKFILATACQDWKDLEGNIVSMTATEAALTELKRTYPGFRTSPSRSAIRISNEFPPPLYYTGPFRGEGCYIDIKSAYATVGRLSQCLNDTYPQGYGNLPLKPVLDNLEGWKRARNSLFGLMKATGQRVIKHGKERTIRSYIPQCNPSVWCNTQAVMHAIAYEAVKYGALYINTDGYIFPNKGYREFMGLLDDLGMVYRHYEADIRIKTWSAYLVGNEKEVFKTTQLYKKREESKENARHFCTIRWVNVGEEEGEEAGRRAIYRFSRGRKHIADTLSKPDEVS